MRTNFFSSFAIPWVRFLSIEEGNIGNPGGACEIQGARKVLLKI
jgi:hypothetical protein